MLRHNARRPQQSPPGFPVPGRQLPTPGQAQGSRPKAVGAQRLSRGLLRLGQVLQWLVQGRGRALTPLEFNQP